MPPCKPPAQREAPSREIKPYVFEQLDANGQTIAEIDPDRRSILIVSTVAAGGIDAWVVEDLGSALTTQKRYPLSPGEGVTLSTAGKVVVRSSSSTVTVSVKTLIERGVV